MRNKGIHYDSIKLEHLNVMLLIFPLNLNLSQKRIYDPDGL